MTIDTKISQIRIPREKLREVRAYGNTNDPVYNEMCSVLDNSGIPFRPVPCAMDVKPEVVPPDMEAGFFYYKGKQAELKEYLTNIASKLVKK